MQHDYYNIAIKYLQGKYGKICGYTSKFQAKLRFKTAKEHKTLIESATDRDRDIIIQADRIDKASKDYPMFLLCQQYSLGIGPKKELHELLENKFGELLK